MPPAEERQPKRSETTRRKARRVAQRATKRAAKEAERAAPSGASGSREVIRPSRRAARWLLRPTTKKVAQPKGAVQPARPVAISSSEEHEGSFAQDRSFLLFPAAAEDACEWCLQEFTPRLPFAPAARPGKPPASQGRSDLRLCSGCVPLVHLMELAQTGSEEQREFIRLAAASLSTFLKTRANYPLPLELGGFRWTQPAQPRRANPYGGSKGSRSSRSGAPQPKCRPQRQG